MALTIAQWYWMISTVLTMTTSLSYNVPTLHPLIVDVLTLTLMMLLCPAVSCNSIIIAIHICCKFRFYKDLEQ